jgi:hypothetical protein
MGETINGAFETRRDAEMAVERLVQELHLPRADIFLEPVGPDNSVGEAQAGSDAAAAAPSVQSRGDAPLNGRIKVSVDLNDGALSQRVRGVFEEFSASPLD